MKGLTYQSERERENFDCISKRERERENFDYSNGPFHPFRDASRSLKDKSGILYIEPLFWFV